MPLLTKFGCNSGGCHGKLTGQNGFRLSLLGYEPDFDYDTLVKEARGRRVNLAAPERSLLLLKATGRVPHGGGVRFDVHSADYRSLLHWIASGAPAADSADPVIERIAITPGEKILALGTGEQPLQVTAILSNGATRDVTRLSLYQSNDPEVADVTEAGLVQVRNRSGLFAVMVRYGSQLNVFQGTVPFRAATSNTPSDAPASASFMDSHLHAQWQRLGLERSPWAADNEFLRRATLDICGTLPTAEETAAYAADSAPDKQSRLIDRLLERPEYASHFAMYWAAILQNRGSGYSTSKQRAGTALFSAWIRDSFAANKPYDQFVTEILTASGSQETNPPAVWYRTVRTTKDYVESVSQAFLGVRIQCAQCHHHPAERWSQDDYYGLAAAFSRVGRKGGFSDAEVPTSETIFLQATGELKHPRTSQVVAPRPLGGPDFAVSRYDDPRRSLAAWMTSPDNPYFARTMANRLWGHFLGRGIIHPIDDARSTNPPSNPALLDALAAEFVAHRYDVKHLIRVITNSAAYRLSALPNDTNRQDVQSFARFYARRLPAEVLLDGISQVLDAPTKFSAGAGAFPAGMRAIDLPDEAVPSHFLDVFGRPNRSSACDCERVDAPALGQALELVNSTDVQQKLAAPTGYAARLAADPRPHAEKVHDVFQRVFTRPPRSEELATACRYLESEPDPAEGYRSLLWSLLATNEFLFNH